MLRSEDLDTLERVYTEAEQQAEIIASEMKRYDDIYGRSYDLSFDFSGPKGTNELWFKFYVPESGDFDRYLPIEWLTYDRDTITQMVDAKIKAREEEKRTKETLRKTLANKRKSELERFEYMRLKHIHGDDYENDRSYVLSVLRELDRCIKNDAAWCGEIYRSLNYSFRYSPPAPYIKKFEFSLGGVNGTVEMKDGVPTINRECYYDLTNSGAQQYFDLTPNLLNYS